MKIIKKILFITGVLMFMSTAAAKTAKVQAASGPSGASDKDRVYILMYQHTDYHAGEYPMEYVFENHFTWDSDLRKDFPQIKLGNEFGGSHYDLLETNPQFTQLADLLKKTIRNNPNYPIIGGTWSQAIGFWLPEESAIRQFTYGIDSIERFTQKTVNVYGYSENTGFAYYPQILADFGIKNAVMRTHYQPLGGSPFIDTTLVKWLGIDGSSVVAVPTYEGDNKKRDFDGMNLSEAILYDWLGHTQANRSTRLEEVNRYYDEKKSKGIEYVVMTVIEDFDARALKPLLEQIQRDDPRGEKYKFVTAEELFSIIGGNVTPLDFAPKPNDWEINMNTGWLGDKPARETTETAAYLSAAEAMMVFTKISNENSEMNDLTGQIDKAYQDYLRAEAHGMHMALGYNHWPQLASAKGVAQFALNTAKNELNANIANAYNGNSIVVYNTQGYARKEPIEQTVVIPKGAHISGVKNAATGEDVPFEVIQVSEDFETSATLVFICEIASYSHKLYNVIMAEGQQEPTIKENAGLKTGGTVAGQGYSLTVDEKGEIVSLTTATGQKIITGEGLYLTGNFYDAETGENSAMHRSKTTIKTVYEGAVSTRFIAQGSIAEQPVTVLITVFNELPYFDVKIIANFDISLGIGTYTDNMHSSWGLANDNAPQRKLNINFKPDFQLGGPFEGSTVNPSYPLYDYNAYNNIVNVSRYTPYYPENYKRMTESTMLTGNGVNRINHAYSILSRYYIDVSDTDSGRGFAMLVKGGSAFTYDGNTLGCVIGQSAKHLPITGAMPNTRYALAGEMYTGDVYWDFRFFAHDVINSPTDVTLGNGENADLLRHGLGFNNPLTVDTIKQTNGALPAEYQYLSPVFQDGVIPNNITVRDGQFYIRAFEYKGMQAGDFSMAINGKTAALKPVSMNYAYDRDESGINITPYKIGTYNFTEGSGETSANASGGAKTGLGFNSGKGLWPGWYIIGGAFIFMVLGISAMTAVFKKGTKN